MWSVEEWAQSHQRGDKGGPRPWKAGSLAGGHRRAGRPCSGGLQSRQWSLLWPGAPGSALAAGPRRDMDALCGRQQHSLGDRSPSGLNPTASSHAGEAVLNRGHNPCFWAFAGGCDCVRERGRR